jgi:hypothetical protein
MKNQNVKLDAFGNAKWIWYEFSLHNLVNSWMQTRRTFMLKSVPKSAKINVTADSRYRLFVNGEHVCRGPARGFQKSWPYDTVDIAPFLKKGQNVIAALVNQWGLSTFQYVHEGAAGFLLYGKISGAEISTSPDWRVRPAPGYKRVTTRSSLEMSFQEHYDARVEDGNWQDSDYDDSAWRVPNIRNVGCMPWNSFEERGIPMLEEGTAFPSAIVSRANGVCASGWESADDLVHLYFGEKKEWQKREKEIRVSDGWAAVEVPASGEKQFAAVCVDFGFEIVGSLRIAVEDAEGGEILDWFACEAVDNGDAPLIRDSVPAARQFEAFGNRLILRSGRTEHEQFDHWGFRYIVLVVRNSNRPLKIALKLRSVAYPLEVKGGFECSSERLNNIFEISVRAQKCCMLDAYMDCPWREQAQWWGDARVQAQNTFHLAADARLLKRGIRQIAMQEVPNGLTYGLVPTSYHHCVLPDFTCTWILTHLDYYRQTGDLSLFRELKNRVERALLYFDGAVDKNGLLPYDNRYWLFLDWCPIFKEGYPTLYNLLVLAAYRAAAELFGLIQELDKSRKFALRAKMLEKAIKKYLFDKKKSEFYGGLDWNEKSARQNSGHVYALAVLLDIFPELNEKFAEDRLIPLVKGGHSNPLTPSPFFMFYVFEALKKCGRGEDTVECIERWWGGMLDRGLTTTEEVWNAEAGKHSLCHAWSAHPIVHFLNVILGVTRSGLAWKSIRFEPHFLNLEFAKGGVSTPLGVIESAWEKSKGGYDVFLSLPKGISAEVTLPGVPKNLVTGKTRWRIG